jgi:hypothetical protein
VERLGIESLAYKPGENAGVVVVNWAAAEEGKLGVLCTAEDWARVYEIEEELEGLCANAGGTS